MESTRKKDSWTMKNLSLLVCSSGSPPRGSLSASKWSVTWQPSWILEWIESVLRSGRPDRRPLRMWVSSSAAAAAKSLQLCLTLCDPRDGSPTGSPVPGILQARTLEWVAISFSNAWKWKVKGKSLSRVQLPATPWTAAYQAPPSMGFARQEYWSGVPLPSTLPCIK